MSPVLTGWGDETNKYQSSSGMISFKDSVQYARQKMDDAIVEAAKDFEKLKTNTSHSVLDDTGFTPEFDQYLETNQTVVEAEDHYYFMEASYDQEILSQMIKEYKSHNKMIDVKWMEKDLYNQ